jgi:ankyrin repeat protein
MLFMCFSNITKIQESSKNDVKSRRRGAVTAVTHQTKQPPQSANEANQDKYLRFQLEKDISNNSLLHAAAFSGSEVMCRDLLAAGLAANKINDLALTPLHLAAMRGHASCVNVLAKSLLESTKHSHPDLDAAVLQALLLLPEDHTCCDHLKTLILAVSQLSGVGIDENLHNGMNLAHAAVVADRGDIVQALVELKAKSSVPTFGVTSIVHACAYFNRPKILTILISKGVECCSVDSHHRTPFHMCMLNGSTETAVALAQMRRYPVRAKDNFGLTAVNYMIVELLKSASINRSCLKLDVSKHALLIKIVLAVVKICPEVLLDPIPCGISVFHLLATDSSSKVVEILQQLSSAVGEVIYAMPSNPFDARIVPVPVAETALSHQLAASQTASSACSRINNTIWMQPFLRPGDTPSMVAVRCCNPAALSVITRFAANPNKRCSGRSPLAQALQPRLQQHQNYCSDLAQILLVHSSGGFCDQYDAKIVAAAVARHAGLYKNLLLKPSPLLEKLKSYKALSAAPCFRFKRNALCEIFLRQPLVTVQQVVSVMHSGHFAQVSPESVCDLNGNSILHHIFIKNRSESHVLGLWNLCLSVMESGTKEQLANLRNKRGKTLLHKVCRFCTVRTVQVVLRALFDQSVVDYAILFVIPKQSSCSPFSRALKYGNSVLVQFLLSLDKTVGLFKTLHDSNLSQTFQALQGPKSSLQKLQTFSNRSICLDILRNKLHFIQLLESMSLQNNHRFQISLKRCAIRNSMFPCLSYDETGFPGSSAQTDISEIINMFECIPFKESSFPPRIQLPKCKTECGPRQLKISQTWDKILDFFVSMNDAVTNYDSTALSFNSQKSILQLSQLPDPSNVFTLSIVWLNLSNVISNILCHHAAKLENDFATFHFSDDFTQRLRFLIDVGQDAPSYCRPDAHLIHRTLGMELDDVDAFIASQISINETAARVCANAALMLETLCVYVKCLEDAKDMFAKSSQFVLERLSDLMNQSNPTSESLLSACSKIPPLLYSHVQCCYLMSIANFALESIGLPEQSLNDLLLDSENMQNAFKSVVPSDLKSFGSWKSELPHNSDKNLDTFYYVDFKSCVFLSNGLYFLKHLLCMSSPLNPRDLRTIMMDLSYFLESQSPSFGVIESCKSLATGEDTAMFFTADDVQRILYLCASAKQFESMKVIIETTYSSLDTCELLTNCDSFYSASEILSSVKNSLQEHDIFERVIASKLSQLGSSCTVGMQLKKDSCDAMLCEAARVLAEASRLCSTFIHDVTHDDASIIKRSLSKVILECDALADLIKKDTCIPHLTEPWCKVSITQEALKAALCSTVRIIDDVKRIASSHEILRLCRIFEGKGVLLLPSAVIHLSLNPLNLGPLLPSMSEVQVKKWLGQDAELCQSLSLKANLLSDWMSTSNNMAMDHNATSNDLLACIPKFLPIKEAVLEQLQLIIDIETFIRTGTIEVKHDCVDILKSYFQDSDSCDAIANFVTKESSELYQVLQCIVDANAHHENLVHLSKHFKTLENVNASDCIKSKILALNGILETTLLRERQEAAIKIQRIARGVLVRRLSRVEVASSTSVSKEEFKFERQCTVRNAFASKIVNELIEVVYKLKGLNDLKYRYDPSEWRAQYFRRCQVAVAAENQRFNTFFSVCRKLDCDALTYESLDESALKMAALDVKNIQLSYSEEDWIVARREFCVDIQSIESKLQSALNLCLHRGEESRCILKLRAAQSRVCQALDAGNHLLALDDASSHWDIDPALSSSQLVNHEVQVLRNSVANSILQIASDRQHLEKLAGAYSKSLNNITFLMEQSQYDYAHRCIVQTVADLDEFKALADRFSGLTVRSQDIPQVDFSEISRLQSTLLIVEERDQAIEQLEAQEHCIGGSYHLSYALINHVHSIIIKSDPHSQSALSGPLFQIRDRVDDAVRLMYRELRRTASSIKMERVHHLETPLISIISSHHRVLETLPLALEYSTKVGHISADELSRVLSCDFASQSAQEINPTWWSKAQKQLLDEVQLLDTLNSLNCHYLKEAPEVLMRMSDKPTSKFDFVQLSSSFILHHLVPLTRSSSDQLPLPSLVNHIDLSVIIPSLLANIHSFISEFDVNSSTLISNIQQLSLYYSKSTQQLASIVAEVIDGRWDLCAFDILSPIKDDFDKCETLVVRTLSLLDFFPPGFPVCSEHLRWFKSNAATGSKAAEQCYSFIEKVTIVQEGKSNNSNPVADVRVRILQPFSPSLFLQFS